VDELLSKTLRIIEAEAEQEGVVLTSQARLILTHLAEAGGEAVATKLWRLALHASKFPQ